MTVEVAGEYGERALPDYEYVDIKVDGDFVASVSDSGEEIMVQIFEPDRPEDALETFKFEKEEA